MTKPFCDICGSEIPKGEEKEKREYVNKEPVLNDASAKVCVSAHFSFVKHSTGFGGPPDLCRDCRNRIIRGLIR